MKRGYRNNNPGNIRISPTKYLGEVSPSQDRAFKQFKTMAWGYRAVFVLLHTYRQKYGLKTIRQMIPRYAPPEDKNHTDIYIHKVAEWTCIHPDRELNTTNPAIMVPFVAAISRMENGQPAVMSEVRAGWDLFTKHKP